MLARGKLSALGAAIISLLLSGCFRGGREEAPRYHSSIRVTYWNDHDWAEVLHQVVTEDGYVDYELLLSNADGVRDTLIRYVQRIGAASPANRPELFPSETDKLAYYLNAFNALAMYAVTEQDLPGNIWLSGVLHSAYLPMGGRRINLDELEARIIRPFGDPRVHFALNWMSRSCPPLRREPYEGARLDEQLDDQGMRYLSDPRAVQAVDADRIRLTELITRFYPQDFTQTYERLSGVTPASIIEAVAPYAAPESPIHTAKDYVALPFDWTLNRAP